MGREPAATNKGVAITGLVTGLVGLALSSFYTIWLVSAAPWSNRGYAERVADADSITELETCDEIYCPPSSRRLGQPNLPRPQTG